MAIAGRTADEVSAQDAPWYPQVWPSVSNDELEKLKTIAERMPLLMKKFEVRRKQMRPRHNPTGIYHNLNQYTKTT